MNSTQTGSEGFGAKNDHQLVNAYNKELKSGGSRVEVLTAILQELASRGIDIAGEDPAHPELSFLMGDRLRSERDHYPSTEVKLIYRDASEVRVKVRTIFIDEPYVPLKKILQMGDGDPVLLIIRHDQLQTHIDASEVVDHRLAAFDHADLYTAISVLNSESTGTFGLLSQARTALVFRPEQLEKQQGLERIKL
jgi:hypothetical protein